VACADPLTVDSQPTAGVSFLSDLLYCLQQVDAELQYTD
jgi:hypothetical protein